MIRLGIFTAALLAGAEYLRRNWSAAANEAEHRQALGLIDPMAAAMDVAWWQE